MVYATKGDTVQIYETQEECFNWFKNIGMDEYTFSECLLGFKTFNGWEFKSDFALEHPLN